MKNAKPRLQYFDFIKGGAIIAIVLYHLLRIFPFPELIQKVLMAGGSTTHLFIFASAFTSFLSLKNKPDYRGFWLRRFGSIYFAFVLASLVIFLFGLGQFFSFRALSWGDLVNQVLLTGLFNDATVARFGDQFWFVSLILQIYLLFPLLYQLGKKIGTKRLLWLGIIVNVLYALGLVVSGLYTSRVWNSFILQFLGEIVFGIWLADKYSANPATLEKFLERISGWPYLAGFFAAYIISTLLPFDYARLFNDPFILFFFMGLFYRLQKLLGKRLSGIVSLAGKYSLYIFLYHMLAIDGLIKLIASLS